MPVGDTLGGSRQLVFRHISCDCDAALHGPQKWWAVEVFHGTLTAPDGLAPTQMLRTQSRPVFRSLHAVFELDCWSSKIRLTPPTLRVKLLTNAARSAFEKLR